MHIAYFEKFWNGLVYCYFTEVKCFTVRRERSKNDTNVNVKLRIIVNLRIVNLVQLSYPSCILPWDKGIISSCINSLLIHQNQPRPLTILDPAL